MKVESNPGKFLNVLQRSKVNRIKLKNELETTEKNRKNAGLFLAIYIEASTFIPCYGIPMCLDK